MNDMTLKYIRNYALDQRSWASTGTTFNNKVRSAINTIVMDISRRAPTVFTTETIHTFVYEQLKSTDETVNCKLNATADDQVLEFLLDGGGLLDDWVPTTDGTWDHIMYLEITRPDGVVERRRSRSWKLERSFAQGTDRYYVSLDRPWRNDSDADMDFRIYQPYIWLPSRARKLLPPVNVWDTNRIRPFVISANEFERNYYIDFQGQVEGPPEHLYPGRDFFKPLSPKTAPTITAGGSSSWVGKVQEGDWIVYQTYVVGKTDARWQDSPLGNARDPIYESSPSPPSATFSHTTNAGKSLVISLRSPDQELGYGDNTLLRYGMTGYRSRIYIAQTSLRTTGAGTFNNVDADSVPYLVAEVAGYTTSYTWTGEVVPDRMRRMRSVGQYLPWHVHPNADQTYEFDMACQITPEEMVNDYDSIPIDPVHFKGFIAGVLAELCGLDGVDLASKREYDLEYSAWIKGMIAEAANPTGRVQQSLFGIRYRERRPFTSFDYRP